MRISTLVRSAATRMPRLARALVGAWSSLHAGRPLRAHWLLRQLRSDLDMRMRRRVRLRTGEWMYVDPFDEQGSEIVTGGCYEPHTVELLAKLLGPGMVVVDAGANMGQYTLIASTLVGASGRVHAFEPNPETFRLLEANLALNACGNVDRNELGLSRAAGVSPLYLPHVVNIGAASLQPGVYSCGRQVDIRLDTLDHYAEEKRLMRLDLVKSDVEGVELLLLEGGLGTLRRFRPSLVLEFSVHGEKFGYRKEDLAQWLADLGYELFKVAAMPLRRYAVAADREPTQNVFAFPRERSDELARRGVVDAAGP